VQETQEGLKWKATRQLFISADGVNQLGNNIYTYHGEESSNWSQVGLEANAETTKHI
jgi:hypothetical protein